jgi:cytochrome c oxidase subunit IV
MFLKRLLLQNYSWRVKGNMHKQLIYLSLLIWGFILLMTFVTYVFDFYRLIESNVISSLRVIFIVIEVVGFVIGCLGLLLHEK